jgi:hypothetical protein
MVGLLSHTRSLHVKYIIYLICRIRVELGGLKVVIQLAKVRVPLHWQTF